MKYSKIVKLSCAIAPLILSLQPVTLQASEGEQLNTTMFSVKMDASRIIYSPESKGASLTVSNPQAYPILIQPQVFTEDMKSKAPFIVTPPLSRLDAKQQNRLRIVRTGANFATDRESLQWLCVTAIPPKSVDEWAQSSEARPEGKLSLGLNISVKSCIKLLVRPTSLNGNPDAAGRLIKWNHQGNMLKGTNDSPFYMNISSLVLGDQKIKPHHISPFSSFEFPLSGKASNNTVRWKVINDYGGESSNYQFNIKS